MFRLLPQNFCALRHRRERRKSRRDFVGYFDVPESEVYTPEFTVRAHYDYHTYDPTSHRIGQLSVPTELKCLWY